jgi:hypothetical protein
MRAIAYIPHLKEGKLRYFPLKLINTQIEKKREIRPYAKNVGHKKAPIKSEPLGFI